MSNEYQEGAGQQTKQEIKRVSPIKDTTRVVTVAVQTGSATFTA